MNGFEEFIRLATLLLISVIGYFVRMLITEHKRTREELMAVLRAQAVEQEKYMRILDDIVQLRKSDENINSKLTDAIERLIRIEAASNPAAKKTVRSK